MTDSSNHPWNYSTFLDSFSEQGYSFVFFEDINNTHGQVALRHDIDFDTALALQAARTEHEKGIKSTFFFLLRSELYNIFSGTDYSNVMAIKELGHTISIHFDPTIYTDFHAGLQQEVAMFKTVFDTDVKLISLHRPNEFFQQYDEPINGIEHTYMSRYFSNIKYFADSTGNWRFGHPVDSDEFAERKTLHVLIHPIWWQVPGDYNLTKLAAYYKTRVGHLNGLFYDNCIPFRQIYDKV
jgi:hypothetical protein